MDTSRSAGPGPRPAVPVRLATWPVAGLAALPLAAALALRTSTLLGAAAGGAAPRLDATVELTVVAAGTLAAGWWGLSSLLVLLCLGARAAGLAWRGGERLVRAVAPLMLRRGLALVVAGGIGLAGAGAATAATSPSVPTLAPGDDLGWPVSAPAEPPTPQGADGAGRVPAGAVAGTAVPATAAAGTVVVRPGDCLWDLARDQLGADPPAGDVAAAWPRWYELNAEVIGADPDLLRPGQVLVVPEVTP